MAIIEDVDSDASSSDVDESPDVERERNFQREERDFIARKEASLREQELLLQQAYAKPQSSNGVEDVRIRKSKRRRQEQWFTTNAALNEYLNGSLGVDDLPGEGLLQDTLETSRSVLQVDSAEDIDIDVLEKLASLLSKSHTESIVEDPILTRLLVEVCELLKVPRHFMLPDYEQTAEVSQRQAYWRVGSTALLQFLQALLLMPASKALLDTFHSDSYMAVDVVVALARFFSSQAETVEEAAWSSPLSSSLAQNLLTDLLASQTQKSRIQLVRTILLNHLKPLFHRTPHKNIHPETGRRLDRQRGGDQFSDTWVEQLWKGKTEQGEINGAVGCWKVLEHVLSLLEPQDMEDLWPLVVPPLMTLLDDHETKYRIQGVLCLSVLLERTSSSLLVKTGLSTLVQNSMTATYSFTSEVDNVALIRASFHANLKLIDLLYPEDAASRTNNASATVAHSTASRPNRKGKPKIDPELERFEAHSAIYRNFILSIFAYHSTSVPFLTLAFSCLPTLIRRLGIGCLRFLGDTIPILTSTIGASPSGKALLMVFTKDTVEMYKAALDALLAVYEAVGGTGRMARWRGSILASLGVMWCNLKEGGGQGMQSHAERTDTVALEKKMRDVVRCIREEEEKNTEAVKDIQKIRACDPELFSGLFG